MEKTCLTWQWSRRWTLTPSTKRVSHRGSLLKGVAVYRVLYQSILNAKLTGRKNLGRKRCTSNRDDCKLENTVKQSWFKPLVRASQGVDWSWSQCIKSHHAQTSSGKGLPSNFWTRGQRQKHLTWLWRKELSGPKSSFQMKVNFAFHLETRSQSLEEESRGTDSMLLEVQCEVSTVSDDLGCHVICWCWSTVFLKSTVNAAIYQDILEHFMLPSADKLMEMLISFSSRTWHLPTLPKVLKAGSMTMVLLCLIGQQTRLTWTT